MELPHGRGRGFGARMLLALLLPGAGLAQDQPAAPQNPAEIASRDEPAIFKARANLVLVPVVVRDQQGRAVATLRKEDFQLTDRGRPQEITRFSVERPGARPAPAGVRPAENPENAVNAAPVMSERHIAYVFDDIHLSFEDLSRAREAAFTQMRSLAPTDRAAIYSTSGQTTLDFTDDRDQLRQALNRLRPTPSGGFRAPNSRVNCPDISFYMADLIESHDDKQALSVALAETVACQPPVLGASVVTELQVRMEARRVYQEGAHETRVSLVVLRDVVRRLSVMPGTRTLVFVSPGFLASEQQAEKNELLDRAARAKVVINSLDARGLYTDPTFDAGRRIYDVSANLVKTRYYREEASAQADVLAELAVGSGGSFFQNSNDLGAGFERLAGTPESYYVLGFSPQNLKIDGTFHNVKVAVKSLRGISIAARRGYYAPTRLDDAAETARREIAEALFSREEMHDIPTGLHTQFFKSGSEAATLTVVTHIDPKSIPFRKEDNRNRNTVTIVNAVFDRNGNFVVAVTKTIELRLRDETLTRLSASGMTVRTNLDVKPGRYAIRLVVRDAEGQFMSAENSSIEIP
jgi:VWFA-related protein